MLFGADIIYFNFCSKLTPNHVMAPPTALKPSAVQLERKRRREKKISICVVTASDACMCALWNILVSEAWMLQTRSTFTDKCGNTFHYFFLWMFHWSRWVWVQDCNGVSHWKWTSKQTGYAACWHERRIIARKFKGGGDSAELWKNKEASLTLRFNAFFINPY